MDIATESVVRKVSWRLIPFLGALYLLAFLDRVNVGFAALTMNADLGFSPTVFGTGAGIFFLGYVLFAVPSNLMLQRFGARRWIGLILIMWGALSAAMSRVHSPATFYALRLLLGIAEAGFFPGVILYLTYWFPREERARILGAFMMALPMSSVIGAPVSAALLDLNGGGLRGWQWLFLLEGLPAAAAGFVALKFLTDRPDEAKWLRPEERANLLRRLQVPSAGEHADEKGASLPRALLDPGVLTLSLVYLALVVALYGYSFWLPQIIQSLGTFTHRQIGGLAMLPNLSAALLMYAWGRHSDESGERRWHLMVPLTAAALGLILAAFTREPIPAMIALTLTAVGFYCALPVFWSLSTARLSGASAAAGIGLINAVGNCGGYIGPFAMGWLKQRSHGYSDGLLALAAGLAMGTALVALTHRRSTP